MTESATKVVHPDLPDDIQMDKRHASVVKCDVCGSKADGTHYNAMACRSCTAFFSAITFKHNYICRNGEKCRIYEYDRCVCRSCRLKACFDAGMSAEAVRPQREPTGSQQRRNNIKRVQKMSKSNINSVQIKHSPISFEIAESVEPELPRNNQAEFNRLVDLYTEHLKFMNRSLITTEDFLTELTSGVKYAIFGPSDIDKLASIELGGLVYWIEKLEPYGRLSSEDRVTLFKRYSVRKLALDHFFVASKFPSFANSGSFMMNNNKFVPSYLTGFESNDDNDLTRNAKFRLLRTTIDLTLNSVIKPFHKLDITEVEITALQCLLMWSVSNNQHVSKETCKIMGERRNWVYNCLFEHYCRKGYVDPEIRVGEVLLLLCEIEVLCNRHCKDFQVAQLFKCGKLDDYWYESVCYSDINTNF